MAQGLLRGWVTDWRAGDFGFAWSVSSTSRKEPPYARINYAKMPAWKRHVLALALGLLVGALPDWPVRRLPERSSQYDWPGWSLTSTVQGRHPAFHHGTRGDQ